MIMDIKAILEKLDNLLDNCEMEKAEKYISEMINTAIENEEYGNAITLYNEQIGFFRDCGKWRYPYARYEIPSWS